MRWFYMEGGQELGPFDKERMQELVRQGTIGNETSVRNDSNLGWTTYVRLVEMAGKNGSGGSEHAAVRQEAGAAEPGTALCAECGDGFAIDKMVPYRGGMVCSTCSPALLRKIGEGVAEEQYAGFWIRFLAKVIDGFIILVPLMTLNAALAFMIPEMDIFGNYSGEFAPHVIAALALIYMLQMAIPLAYSTFFVGRYAATPGKMAMGLRVILADGGRVSYPRALGRHFSEFLSKLTLYIGYIMAGFDNEKRALHDHIAGTRVIRK